METFGKKLKDRREHLGFSQSKLAKELGLHHSIIGRYEREQAKPTKDVVKNMAIVLNTSVSFLLDENNNAELFKDPSMLERLKQLSKLPDNEKEHILYTVDAFIKASKLNLI